MYGRPITNYGGHNIGPFLNEQQAEDELANQNQRHQFGDAESLTFRRRTRVISVTGIALSILHVLLFNSIVSKHYEGGWEYVLTVPLDFPVFLLMPLIDKFLPAMEIYWILLIFGSFWWYFLGWFIGRYVIKE